MSNTVKRLIELGYANVSYSHALNLLKLSKKQQEVINLYILFEQDKSYKSGKEDGANDARKAIREALDLDHYES